MSELQTLGSRFARMLSDGCRARNVTVETILTKASIHDERRVPITRGEVLPTADECARLAEAMSMFAAFQGEQRGTAVEHLRTKFLRVAVSQRLD